MKPTIENLQDTFKIGYENFAASRFEADEVFDFYHNRQYTDRQLSILRRRGQPAETYNVIKMFSRMFLGYLSSVVNDIKVTPRQYQDVFTASVLNDLLNYTLQYNNFKAEAEKIKLDGLLAGLMCVYQDVKKTGEYDDFGRPIYRVTLQHIPCQELILDPYSRKEDYSDARFIHRFKWISKEDLENNFGKVKLEELEPNTNTTDVPEADFLKTFNSEFIGRYKQYDNYLVVHTIMRDGDKTWSVFWCNDVILDKQEISFREVKFPYRVQRLNYSHQTEYYGLFREIIETQKSINQALLKIQLMANSKMIFVQKNAVANLKNFTDDVSKVNAVVPVEDLNGILISNQDRDVAEQYAIIDKALERIKTMLSINDSFLGMAYASDSGKKVQLQQQASVVALKYLTTNIESFYRLLGLDILSLIKQYYTATDVIVISDNYQGQRFIQLNTPQVNIDSAGNPYIPMEYVVDMDTGDNVKDEEGRLVMQPVPTKESDIQFTEADVIVESVAYNDEIQQNQQLLDGLLNGNMGQFLMQTNPSGYAQTAALAIQNLKSKVSPELAQIFMQTAQMIQMQQQAMAQQAQQMPQQLPQ